MRLSFKTKLIIIFFTYIKNDSKTKTYFKVGSITASFVVAPSKVQHTSSPKKVCVPNQHANPARWRKKMVYSRLHGGFTLLVCVYKSAVSISPVRGSGDHHSKSYDCPKLAILANFGRFSSFLAIFRGFELSRALRNRTW